MVSKDLYYLVLGCGAGLTFVYITAGTIMLIRKIKSKLQSLF